MVKAAGDYWIFARTKKDQDYLSLLAHSLTAKKKRDLPKMNGKVVFEKFLCIFENGNITVMDISRKDHPVCMKPYGR